MLDDDSPNQSVLGSAIREILGDDETGCPNKDSVYSYKFYKADGSAAASTGSDRDYPFQLIS